MQTSPSLPMVERAPSAVGWRASPWFRWMSNPIGYAVGMPLLTFLGLITSLAIPRFLAPQQFGSYSLLLDVCRYAMRADLGLTQLADRRIAAGLDCGRADEAEHILAARWRIGLIALATVTPAAILLATLTSRLSPLDVGLATSAGIVAMVAGGPSSIYRARGDVFMYTVLTFVFGIGFFIPRLVGVIFGGTTGCFLFLLVWYIAVAAVFWRTSGFTRRGFTGTLPMVRAAFPMFVFAAAWTLYLSAARWVAAVLTTPTELGFFGLGANLVFTGVTTVGVLADIRYPRWLARLALCGERDLSSAIVREALFLALGLASVIAILVPTTPIILPILFPGYLGAERSLIALASAGIPLGVFAWFLPVMIARSTRPMSDAILAFAPASIVLVVAMAAGERLDGLEGLAWGSCASALVALMSMAIVLGRERILSAHATLAFAVLPMLCLALPAATLAGTHLHMRLPSAAHVEAHLRPPPAKLEQGL